MRPRSSCGGMRASYAARVEGVRPGRMCRRARRAAPSLLDDEADDGRERDLLAVAEPPLGLAVVARGEREVAPADRHRDLDEVAGFAVRTGAGALWHVTRLRWKRGGDNSTSHPSSCTIRVGRSVA